MNRPQTTIQIDTHTWIVMREYLNQPKAVVQQITDTIGDSRYMVMVWHPEPSRRVMTGIYDSFDDATKSVPWPPTVGVGPPHPGATMAEKEAYKRRSGIDHMGYPKQPN